MWFKNLRLYRLTQDLDHSSESLHQALASQAFQPCGSQDVMRYGWTPPLGREGSEYVHTANGYTMICARREEKVLPPAVINEHLEDKTAQIKAEEGRPVGRKERQNLKDDIVFELLPRAFTKSTRDFAYIAPREKLILVNAASAKRAEDLLSKLRESLGSLKAIPLVPQSAPAQMMTDWLRQSDAPGEFELGENCELQAGKDSRVVRLRNQDLTAPEVVGHLESGMFVSKLALTWKEAIHFVLDDQFALKQLKFEDALREQAQDRRPESAAEEFDADFAIMTLELSGLIKALLEACGGPEEI